MVVKMPDGETPARNGGLRTGDVILECGGAPVTSVEQFQSLLQEDGSADLRVSRNGGELAIRVEPERNEDGVCQIGAWIRDSMAGIGTLTWYDPDSGKFGALGHGVTDVDTGLLMPFQDGSILPSTVKAVKKGERGAAGELRGDFDLTRDLGALYANTNWGVFGTLDGGAAFAGEPMPTGQPVKGAARILSNVRGDEVASYAVEITRILPDSSDERDMEITVTDADLLALTGGIVQGMSGSPIVQDGKFVGAVTHVLLQDPARGYGISMENMLAAA
ncbi:MAG: SpoIVB peptidase [Oscillibacter sp.]|nr:SpoIVB peptidase [Oscillibacter sp.]